MCWFSAGAASAVATKLVIAEAPDDLVIAYTDPGSEHPDNARFLDDCEQWFDREILRLRSDKYRDTWQVWTDRVFLGSTHGQPCTVELKKKVRYAFERRDDIHVFGYTVDEVKRADRFREANPGVTLDTPLIRHQLTKQDCLALVERAGIRLPAMYLLGYQNNNCIGCPKGGMGYWNKIRTDFPEVFDRMARLERAQNHSVLKDEKGPVFLDELDPSRGNLLTEPSFECSLLCVIAEPLLGESA